MVDLRRLSEEIRRLYEIVDELESVCSEHGRHFTLDGHLLGSIGEVYAAERYGLRLLASSAKRHDAVTRDGTGRLVQIKVTQSRAKKKAVPLSYEPDYLLVLVVDEGCQFEEVYNGPGDRVWDLVRNKAAPLNGQYQVSLARLRELNKTLGCKDRIEPVSR
ncbi:MAG: hypothetical protein IKF14_01410 [Atopobiaceae bacterium]|nr:hypothetical protein [Atopobiaceae bacterium]